MTKLVDDVAEAIEGYHGPKGARYAAIDAIAVFAKWLREPSENMLEDVGRYHGLDEVQTMPPGEVRFFLRALASHLERQE